MAFLTGLKVGKTPSPGLGALTGFLGGVSEGIQNAEQIKAQRARLALAGQEMKLREAAFAHGLEQEKQVREWSQKFGNYKAWRDGGGANVQIPGQLQVGPDDDPSAAHDSGRAMSPARSETDYGAIHDKIIDLIQSMPNDPVLRRALLDTIHQEEQTKALLTHQNRIASSINDRILNGSYSKRLPGGGEDPSGAEIAQQLLEEVKNADPSNPEEMAQLLDHVEASDLAIRQATVAHNVQMIQRDQRIQSADQMIQERSGAGMNMGEAQTLLEAYKGGLIDDASFQKSMPDAMNGTLRMKMEKMQADAELAQTRMELIQAQTELQKANAIKTQNEIANPKPDATALEDQRQKNRIALEELKGRIRKNLGMGSNGSAKPIDRARLIHEEADSLRKSAPDGTTDADIQKAATKNVDALLKQKSPEEQLAQEIKDKKITSPEEVRARAKELGAKLKP